MILTPQYINCDNPVNQEFEPNYGLQAWWKVFSGQEVAGSFATQVWLDLVSKRVASLNNGLLWKADNSLGFFTSSYGLVNITKNVVVQPSPQITLSFKLKVTNLSTLQEIIRGSDLNTGSNFGYSLAINVIAGKYSFFICTGGGSNHVDATIPDTNYHIVTCTYNINQLQVIYIDGVLKVSVDESAFPAGIVYDSSGSILIGNASSISSDEPFTGNISSFRIWNRALNAREVYALYEDELSGYQQSLNHFSNKIYFPVSLPIPLALKSTSQSESLAYPQVSIKQNKNSNVVSQSLLNVNQKNSQKLSSSIITQSLGKSKPSLVLFITSFGMGSFSLGSVKPSTSKHLQSTSQDISYLQGVNSKKIALYSLPTSQSYMEGQEVLNRIIEATSKSISSNISEETKKIAVTSKMQSESIYHTSEVITRLLNGIAESISIAQKCGIFINRLFVSSALANAFSKNTEYITKGIHAAFFSESYIYGPEVAVRELASKSESSNPFHGNRDILYEMNSSAATASLLSAQKKVLQPISGKAISTNPFHANPNLQKELQAVSQAASFAAQNSLKKKINLLSESITESQLGEFDPLIARHLSTESLSESEYHSNGFDTLVNINGSMECCSVLHVLENKKLNLHSEPITQSLLVGTDNYLGSHYEETSYKESSDLGVINLAPFNYPDELDSTGLNPD